MITKEKLHKACKLCGITADFLKRSAGKKFRELNIANGASFSKEIIEIIKDTDKQLRATWDHYITHIARSIASKIKKVEVKIKKTVDFDNSLLTDFELAEAYVVDEQDARDLLEAIGTTIAAMETALLQNLQRQQKVAYLLGLKKSFVTLENLDPKDIDPEILKLNESDLSTLNRELEDQEKYLKKFMSKLKDKYRDVMSAPPGKPYVAYESPQELMETVENVDTTSVHQLDLYAIAAIESAMMAGTVEPHKSQGVSGGIWHTMHDGKVCPDCAKLEGTWMTWDEFHSIYKNTLCNGSCRCGELFEPTNNTTDPYSNTYGKDYYMGEQPEKLPCIKPVSGANISIFGKLVKTADVGASPGSVGCALVQNAENASRKLFKSLSSAKKKLAKRFNVSPKVDFNNLPHFFTPSSAQFKSQVYRALDKFDDTTIKSLNKTIKNINLVSTSEFVKAGGQATNAVLFNKSVYINSELSPYSLGNDLFHLFDFIK